MWRSLVAHLTGGQGVAGSNPVIPTNLYGGFSLPLLESGGSVADFVATPTLFDAY